MKKILLSLAVIAIVGVGAIGATRAYFSDTASSTGNTFTAGTMDLIVTPNSSFAVDSTPLFTATNMAPGDQVTTRTLYFKNAGSIAGKVKLNVSYTSADIAGGTVNVSDDDYARNMIVTNGTTDGINVTSYWATHIVVHYGSEAAAVTAGALYFDGTKYFPTVFGLKTTTMYFDNGTTPIEWGTGATHNALFTLMLSPAVGNAYQANGINVTLTATMAQFNDPSAF